MAFAIPMAKLRTGPPRASARTGPASPSESAPAASPQRRAFVSLALAATTAAFFLPSPATPAPSSPSPSPPSPSSPTATPASPATSASPASPATPSTPATPESASDSHMTRRKWDAQELCASCSGRGTQPCSLCDGSGILVVDDSVVYQENICPNCFGAASVRCPACIGLGLADVSGILRNGARDGTLRMLRDGSYEVLDCSAFPACDIYNAPKRSTL